MLAKQQIKGLNRASSIPTCIRLLQQRANELQVAVDVAVDVGRPLGALVELS